MNNVAQKILRSACCYPRCNREIHWWEKYKKESQERMTLMIGGKFIGYLCQYCRMDLTKKKQRLKGDILFAEEAHGDSDEN